MNVSEAEGILAKYSAVSDVDFRIDPALVTDESLNDIRYMIRDFAKAKQNLEEANSRNSWKNNSMPEMNQEKKQDMIAYSALVALPQFFLMFWMLYTFYWFIVYIYQFYSIDIL